MFYCHPDAISITVVLVPPIEKVAIFFDTSEGIMRKTRSHNNIFIHALKIIVMKLLHSTRSINLGVNLQHFWVCVMIVEATMGFPWAEPYVRLDVKLLNTTPLAWLLRSSHSIGIKFKSPYIKLWRLLQGDILWVSRVQGCELTPTIIQHHATNVGFIWEFNQDKGMGANDVHT